MIKDINETQACAMNFIVTPAVSDNEDSRLFPKGFRNVKPYLRYTPQPDK